MTHGNPAMSLTQQGNPKCECYGQPCNNNNMSVTIDGDSNTTHTEIGNGGDT